ncbi:MAG: hypothetical protein ACRDA0_07905 [Cetobacterium sp.]|uniref:hypothetical protein n=1 Tax=Cetobacterium sp. TaxID=2071632 RepID=UPI003F2F7999
MKRRKKIYLNLRYAFEKIKHLEGITLFELAFISNLSTKTLRRYLLKKMLISESDGNTHRIFVKSLLENFVMPTNNGLPQELQSLGFFPELNAFLNHKYWTVERRPIKKKLTLIETKNRKFVCVISSLKYLNFILNAEHSYKRREI